MSSITYKNEGFLYINLVETQTTPFISGQIIDTDDNLICPGEIIPTIYENENETIKENTFKFFTPLLKGIRIRIYWYSYAWHISTVNKIYYIFDLKTNTMLNEQINFDLLDENNVYYATITTNEVILTYITEKKAPELHLPELEHDIAFTHHLSLIPLDSSILNYKTIFERTDYGILVFQENGEQMEVWSKNYYLMKSMEKPNKVSIYKYYFQCLNHYAEDFDSLLCDINQFILFYPEHKERCDTITKKIVEYIENKESIESIESIKYLLSLNLEDSLNLISLMPSRRTSVI